MPVTEEYNALPYRDKLIIDIWEAYKDAYGYRPRHIDFASLTDIQLEELYKKVCEEF